MKIEFNAEERDMLNSALNREVDFDLTGKLDSHMLHPVLIIAILLLLKSSTKDG